MRTARGLRPYTTVHNDLRGGCVWAIDGSDVTLRVRINPTNNRDYVVAADLVPAPISLGMPIVVRVAGDPLEVVAVYRSIWGLGRGPLDEAGAVAAGDVHVAIITPDHDGSVPWGFF